MNKNRENLTLGSCFSLFIEESPRKRERKKRTSICNNPFFESIKKVPLNEASEVDVKKRLEVDFKQLQRSLRCSKTSGYQVINDFFDFLKRNYAVDLDIKDYLTEPKKEGIDRLLDILKVLQGQGMRRIDLCHHYDIEDDTLRGDLTQLETGIDILGQNIHVDRKEEDGRITFDSSVHPIFLPLNLTEAFALIVGLKRLNESHPQKEILDYLADWIYSQLSEFAQNKIRRSINFHHYNITFRDSPRKFSNEQDHFNKPYFKMTYYEKSIAPVCVIYDDGEKTTSVKGRIRATPDGETIVIRGDDGISTEVAIKDIFSIEEDAAGSVPEGDPRRRRTEH